jgi:hypothetical protein
MVFLDGSSLLALEGTGYVSSQTLHCASCLHKVHRPGAITYDPQRLGAAMLPPDCRAVMPLLPEPSSKHEGTEKKDGERQAAKRFMIQWRQAHPPLQALVTADRLRAHAPPIETLHAHGCHSLLGGNEGDHASGCTQGQRAAHDGRGTAYERHERAAGLRHRLRFVHDVPLHASHADVRGNGIESWDIAHDKVQPCSGVTDVRVNQRNVFRLMRGGRARGKIENATCKTLQNQGENCAHNSGPGAQPLSGVFALLLLLAFLVEQTQQRCWAVLHAVWAKLGSKRWLGERLRALGYD